MRIIFCGDRNWVDRVVIEDVIKSLPENTTVITGDCRGADTIARDLSRKHGLITDVYRANWYAFGKSAGPIRNLEMLEQGQPDMVYAFHDNVHRSKGTKNMIKLSKNLKIPVKMFYSHKKQKEMKDQEMKERNKMLHPNTPWCEKERIAKKLRTQTMEKMFNLITEAKKEKEYIRQTKHVSTLISSECKV